MIRLLTAAFLVRLACQVAELPQVSGWNALLLILLLTNAALFLFSAFTNPPRALRRNRL